MNLFAIQQAIIITSLILLFNHASGSNVWHHLDEQFPTNEFHLRRTRQNNDRSISSSVYLSTIKNTYQKQDASFLSSIKLLYGTGHLLFFTLKEKNITRAIDLNDRKIAVISHENFEMYDAALQYYSQRNNVTISPQLVHQLDYLSNDCVWGDPMNYYDVLVTDLERLQFIILYTSTSFTKKEIGRWSDYQMIRELTVPTLVKYIDRGISDFSITLKMDYFINNMLTNTKKSDYFDSNVYQLQYLYGNGGFLSKNDQDFLNFYFQTGPLRYYQKNETFQFSAKFNGTLIPLNNVFCFLPEASFHSVCGDISYYNYLLGTEAINYVVIVVGALYYLSLLTVCKTNTIKRRLLTPYLIPVLVMFNAGFYSRYTDRVCHSMRMVFLLASIALLVGVYGVTLMRFYYLRNLYCILKNIPERFIKLNRFLSSTGFGIVSSLVCGCVFATISIIYVTTYHFTREQLFSYGSEVVFTSTFMVLSCASCLCGIIVFGIDIIVNWRKIKAKGIIHFLTFEDPYHVRLDILTYVCVILCILAILFFNAFYRTTESYMIQTLFRSITFMSVYFLCGWTAIIMEWINFFRRRKRGRSTNNSSVSPDKRSESGDESIEELVKIDAFFEMFKSFSEKEFSLENSLLFERFKQLESSSIGGEAIPPREIEDLYDSFFRPYAIYEVNFSYKTRRDIEAIFQSKKGISINDLKAIIEFDLLMNMKDTFERLRMTGEFKRWHISKSIQSMQSI
ncbi:predicted protein [Naegleria gruberi]|uniref:Predicted protein n=1 Tax=Naegleria gruberi TaxID=5762 RepID=D2W0N9_NAEGR|nr:uncharacterized protein NAEGRDRAFT_81945 [Naegleria gruberi]EFC37323.1 predicted protein [Naegleria gruberi]|eukprot:XP_002670067.1 predicted protein [Naegleria gruberi strain NEG-M]